MNNTRTQSQKYNQPTFSPVANGLLQRKCACGGSAGLDGGCEECRKKQLQRRSANGIEPTTVLPIVNDALRLPWQLSNEAAPCAFMEPRFGRDLSRIPTHFPAVGAIQTKLAINKPGDEYEQEADRIANQVLAVPAHSVVSGASPHIQRFAEQPTAQEDAVPSSVDRVLARPGRPLDPPLQQDMEQRFGHDFSQVRVHSDVDAEQSTRDVKAHAYTVGNNIVFGAGRFAPTTQEGRRLLVHELTHVVQQSGTDGSRIDQRNETGGLPPIKLVNQAVQQATGQAGGERLQRWSWAEIKEKAYDSMIAGIHKARDGMRNGLKRLAAAHLPASLFPIADGIIEVAVTSVEVLVAIIMAVLGIVVGFSEGIIGMIEGLFKLAYGVITLIYDLIAGIFTNFDAAKQDLNAVWSALMNLPSALKKLVTDWLDKFSKASSERQSLMIGELTGQVLALIATFAVAAGRAGSAAKAGATASDAAGVGSETAAVAGATSDTAITAARAKPLLTVIEGGGGRGGSTAARAATGPGASDIVGSNALKVAPTIEEAPAVTPLRIVPPVEAPVAVPQAAEAAAAAAVPRATTSVGRDIAAGAAVASATAKNLSKEPKKPDNENAMRFQVQWGTNEGGPTFSQVATAQKNPGVTTTQAVDALNATVAMVVPKKAQEAAAPAAAKQIKWILSRPPAGIAQGGYSKSEYFVYKSYTDARVDVENVRGHNLKI